jgi:outer membrane protein assembly factor BamB
MISFKSIFILALLCPFMHFAQVEVKWNTEVPTEILWQEVTALGNLIVSSREGLIGIDAGTGKIVWNKRAHGNLDRAAFEELPNSPFIAVTGENTLHLIDQFSGQEVFNSAKAGLKEISSYFLLYNSNTILVAGTGWSGEPLLVSANMSDGSLSWSLEEKFGSIINVNELDNQELLIVTLFNNYKLNNDTGAIIWKNMNSKENAQLDNLTGLGALLKEAVENMAQEMDFQLRYYEPEASEVFYLGTQREGQTGVTTTTGTPKIKYTSQYNAYNTNDGSLIWNTPLEVKGALSHVSFLDNGLLVLPDDGNRTKINVFDYQTKEGLWGKKGRGIKIKGGIYDYLDSGDGILLVSRTDNNDFLNFLDPSIGAITFEKPVKVEGTVVGIVPLDNSILYVTTTSMNILDHKTGTLKWKNSLQTSPSLTAEHDGKIYAYDYNSGLVKVVDIPTEQLSELSNENLEFDGKETPKQLEIMEDGIFLYSDQNVAKYNFDGSLSFQKYYAAPKEAGWKRALLYGASVRAAYIGAVSFYVSGSIASAEGDIRQKDAVAGEITSQIGTAYGELGNAASSYAMEGFKRANARLKATTEGRDFMFIMSKKEKNVVLLKVSKLTGEVEGEIDLGKDREPMYAVDDITGQVYYQTSKTGLTSYLVN